ncbi:MAG: ABC transporter permease [Planctomycetota bacterium]|nr:ABC transporter permease [Planctomycetota bacterium]
MRLVSISVRNLRVRLVSTVLTTLSTILATALYAAIMMMADQTRQRYEGSIGGFQAVVGPKDASQLELLLNTIFNVGNAPGLVPKKVCDDLRSGRVGRRSKVRYAIPQARGDSISKYAFPVIGTIDEMFTKYEWLQNAGDVDEGRAPLVFAEGGPWEFSYEQLNELSEALAVYESARRAEAEELPERPLMKKEWRKAVIGSRVARTLDLGLGSVITPVHGKLGEFGYHEHPEASCEVVGILAPTNSPLDTTVFLPLGTHLLIGGHEEGLFKVEIPPGKNPDQAARMPVRADQIAFTAIIADPLDHFGATILRREFGTRPDAQVAWPQDVIPKFLAQIGNVADALEVVAWLVLVVAAIAIAVAIYNTMNERRREIAIMRSLGARRQQITAIIVGEAALISLFGAVVGVLVCHLAAFLLRGLVEDLTGVYLDWAAFASRELYLVLAVGVLGAAAGFLPALKGSFTQVADNLSPSY